MATLPEDHECPWKDEALSLRQRLSEVEQAQAHLVAELAELKRMMFGRRSEKVIPIERELKKSAKKDPAATKKKRKAKREKRKKALPERRIEHSVPEEDRCCVACGEEMLPLGPGRETEIIEYIPAHYERQIHVLETLRCSCGEGFATAPAPRRVADRLRYGPRFMAHVVVSKCADSLPLFRQAKAMGRAGLDITRSTLGDIFHTAGDLLEPLSNRILELVAAEEVVQADETPIKIQAKDRSGRAQGKPQVKRGYLWSFLAPMANLLGFVFSPDRSGETPEAVLGGSKGSLVIDGFTGYNSVTTPEGRKRVGCLAHVRRKFFAALQTAPQEAREALDLILEVYKVERDAKNAGIVGSEQHLALRQSRSREAMEDFRAWLEEQEPQHLPKGPLGKAIGYALNQWDHLILFLDDARLPVDNNASERALRVIALGRKNWLFVGNERAGERLAALLTLVMSCEQQGLNAEEYLADVLLRVSTHPRSRIDELLPQNWRGPPLEDEAEVEAALSTQA